MSNTTADFEPVVGLTAYDGLPALSAGFELSSLCSIELLLLLVQMALLCRILRDLSAIDLDRLLAVIKPAAAATSSAAGRVSDEPLTKAQRQQLIRLNGGEHRGFASDDVLRVLLSCGFDEPLVARKLASNRAWHDKYKPKTVTPAQLGNSLPSGTCRLGGFSRCGWPIVEVYLDCWQPYSYSVEEQQRLVAFAFEHSLQRMPAGQDRLAVLADMSGWRLAHSMPHPFSLITTIVQLANGPYVERLGVALFVNTPAVFRATWALLQPMLGERVVRRVVLLGSDWQERVAEHIDADNLPQKLGGKRPLAGPPNFGFI